jgi:serralysin
MPILNLTDFLTAPPAAPSPVPETIATSSNGSSVSVHATSFVNESGAGGMSTVTATSPTGKTSHSHEEIFTPGATSSSASGSGSASTGSLPVTTATADAPGQTNTNLTQTAIAAPPIDSQIKQIPVVIPVVTSTDSPPVTSATANTPAPTEPPLNAIQGLAEDDNLIGTENGDLISGDRGNDKIQGFDGSDRIFGEADDDFLCGNKGDDVLDGGDGNDSLWGGAGNDSLNGGSKDDYLSGDFGVDTLTGGNGADTFTLRIETVNPIADLGFADAITDFNQAEGDQIAIIGDISLTSLVLETIDFNGDGQINNTINPTTGADATLIKLGSNLNDGILAIVLGTVNAQGATTLSISDFIVSA